MVLVAVVGAVIWVNGPWSTSSGGLLPAGGLLSVGDQDAPTPRPASSATPLGSPRVADAIGPHAFAATQPTSDEPVSYDPCRVIHYVVNEGSAPPIGRQLVEEAVAEVSDATGLQFEFDGFTDERLSADRPAFQPERYGDRWAPVLIEWSDEAASPDLVGSVAGFGGSRSVSGGGLRVDVYVSGVVGLDGPQLTDMLWRPDGGPEQVRAVILHELGHLVGLGHVDDPSQLMFEDASDLTGFQAGDLAGLARLGQGRCIKRL